MYAVYHPDHNEIIFKGTYEECLAYIEQEEAKHNIGAVEMYISSL